MKNSFAFSQQPQTSCYIQLFHQWRYLCQQQLNEHSHLSCHKALYCILFPRTLLRVRVLHELGAEEGHRNEVDRMNTNKRISCSWLSCFLNWSRTRTKLLWNLLFWRKQRLEKWIFSSVHILFLYMYLRYMLLLACWLLAKAFLVCKNDNFSWYGME